MLLAIYTAGAEYPGSYRRHRDQVLEKSRGAQEPEPEKLLPTAMSLQPPLLTKLGITPVDKGNRFPRQVMKGEFRVGKQ